MYQLPDNFCWLHAIRLSMPELMSPDLPMRLIELISSEDDFVTGWISMQGQLNVDIITDQLRTGRWPDFDILLPLLSHYFNRTFVIFNLHANHFIQDQIFSYSTVDHFFTRLTSEASAVEAGNDPSDVLYMGLLIEQNHFVSILPNVQESRVDICAVCLEESQESTEIKSTNCFHYFCAMCFDKLSGVKIWRCPLCMAMQVTHNRSKHRGCKPAPSVTRRWPANTRWLITKESIENESMIKQGQNDR